MIKLLKLHKLCVKRERKLLSMRARYETWINYERIIPRETQILFEASNFGIWSVLWNIRMYGNKITLENRSNKSRRKNFPLELTWESTCMNHQLSKQRRRIFWTFRLMNCHKVRLHERFLFSFPLQYLFLWWFLTTYLKCCYYLIKIWKSWLWTFTPLEFLAHCMYIMEIWDDSFCYSVLVLMQF